MIPSEFLATMKEEQQCKGAYRAGPPDNQKFCFNGYLMVLGGFFLRFFDRPTHDKLNEYNDSFPFAEGHPKAIKYLKSLGL